MNEPTNGQTDLDAVLERISPDKREAFLRSRLRLKQFSENDEFLAIAAYLDNYAVLINAFTKDVVPSTNGNQLPAVHTGDHHEHLRDNSEALARLNGNIEEQKAGLLKLDDRLGKLMLKLNTLVRQEPSKQLRDAVKWLFAGIAVLVLAGVFLGGVLYNSRQADSRIERIINGLPVAAQASAALSAHGGSIFIGPIKGQDGREARGIIVKPGNLKQDAGTDGAVLLTLP
jgi:hypothetical protein